MKREQLLTLVLTVVALVVIYMVLKPRVENEHYADDGFGGDARPVYVGGEQKAPPHSADDAIDGNTDLSKFTGSDDTAKKNDDFR